MNSHSKSKQYLIYLSGFVFHVEINPIRLGGSNWPPPRPKKILTFKWLKVRLCYLLTFTENIWNNFRPNLRLINTFFEFLQMFKFKVRPKKRQKIDFSIFEDSYHKNGWIYGQKCLRGNVSHASCSWFEIWNLACLTLNFKIQKFRLFFWIFGLRSMNFSSSVISGSEMA